MPTATPTINAPLPQVTRASHVTLNYRISLAESNADVANTFGQRPATIQMGCGQLAEPLELALMGMTEGERRVVDLPPERAYGPRSPQLLQRLSRDLLRRSSAPDTEYELGDVLEFPGAGSLEGVGAVLAGVLKSIDETSVLVDFNHPLAGHALRFEVQILGILE
jgi:FKBP-type peptidyl-prolyl cis-trans isomerase SlpA